MNEQKVILLCGGRFALPVLQSLIFYKKLAAVCIPEECIDMIEDCRPILSAAGTPMEVIDKKTFAKKIAGLIKEHKVNTGIVATFSYKLPAAVFNLPEFGFYNIHPGLLPAFRGPEPLFQQIRLREKYVGITIHKLDADYDTGPIVMTEKILLHPSDTYGILNEKLGFISAKLVSVLLKLIEFGRGVPSRPQDESAAVYYKKQQADGYCINWHSMDASSIIALINACNPWNKGAITQLNHKVLRIVDAYILDGPEINDPPGTILSIDERGVIIATNDKRAIIARIIYSEEGFFPGNRLLQFGIRPGARFIEVNTKGFYGAT